METVLSHCIGGGSCRARPFAASAADGRSSALGGSAPAGCDSSAPTCWPTSTAWLETSWNVGNVDASTKRFPSPLMAMNTRRPVPHEPEKVTEKVTTRSQDGQGEIRQRHRPGPRPRTEEGGTQRRPASQGAHRMVAAGDLGPQGGSRGAEDPQGSRSSAVYGTVPARGGARVQPARHHRGADPGAPRGFDRRAAAAGRPG